MLTLVALSTVMILQDPPAPPAVGGPEVRTQVFVRGADGPGSLDKDGDGQVSREEFAAPMSDHFSRMDKDGDGRLSTGELGGGPGDHEVMILGGPGGPGIRRFEMRRPHAEGRHGEHDETHERVVIIGGDGAPARRGMTGDSRSGVPGSHVEIRRMGGDGEGDDLDADNDGKVSEAEFTAPLRDAFGRMDKDRSGFIEAGERGAGDGDVRVFTHRIETRREGED